MRGRVSDVRLSADGEATAEFGSLEPAWPPPRELPPGRLGLVRAVDYGARRHRYAAGWRPPGRPSGELGALLSEAPQEGIPLVLDSEGRPVLGLHELHHARLESARWVLEPLGWNDQAGLAVRLRSVARRVTDGLAALRRREQPTVFRAGWLHRQAGDGRSALWAAAHSVLDDVLLTPDPDEPADLGYGPPVLLGFLEDLAPLTGVIGPPVAGVTWARRWGTPPLRGAPHATPNGH